MWTMSLILEKKNIFCRDYSSGFCFATRPFGQELADFYNIYNMPRWVYLGLLEHYTFTTIFLSAAVIFVVIRMSAFGNREPDTGMRDQPVTDSVKIREETIPELSEIKRDFTDLILLDLEGNTKKDIFFGLAKFAMAKGLVNEEATLYNSFLEKEKYGTTAIGNGIALPEALYAKMNHPSAIILCRTKTGVDFDSFDGRPVRIILASLGRDKSDSFILEPRISRILQFLRNEEHRDRFMRARTENDIYRLWKESPVRF